MDNPFCDISDPKQLLVLVQDGVECEQCGRVAVPWAGCPACPTCHGTALMPLPNADLDALAACWCEGEWVWWNPDSDPRNKGWYREILREKLWYPLNGVPHGYCPTTDPVAAMRLMVEYRLSTEPWGMETWRVSRTAEPAILIVNESLCHAITTAALVAALTEAMEGASE